MKTVKCLSIVRYICKQLLDKYVNSIDVRHMFKICTHYNKCILSTIIKQCKNYANIALNVWTNIRYIYKFWRYYDKCINSTIIRVMYPFCRYYNTCVNTTYINCRYYNKYVLPAQLLDKCIKFADNAVNV